MTGITLDYAQRQFTRLSAIYAELDGVELVAQKDRTQHDRKLKEVREEIQYWDQKVKELSAIEAGKNTRVARPYSWGCYARR